MNLPSINFQEFKNHFKQFSRFLIIGGIATAIAYAVFLILLRLFGVHYLIANLMGFLSGVAFGYPLNKKWTFKHDAPHSLFHSYFAVYLASLLLSTIFLKITVDLMGMAPEIAMILSIGMTTCTNFLGTKFFVFKPRLNQK